MSSNIRVSVQWREATVFAGEEVECTITFRNIADRPPKDPSPLRSPTNGSLAVRDRNRQAPSLPLPVPTRPSLSRHNSLGPHPPSQHPRGHRPKLSLYAPSNASLSTAGAPPPQPNGARPASHKHGRSLSIISLGSTNATDAPSERGAVAASRRPVRGHGRSSSLQVVPGRKMGSPTLVSPASRSTAPSPLSPERASPSQTTESQPTTAFPFRSPRRPDKGSRLSVDHGSPAQQSDSPLQTFKFPAAPPPVEDEPQPQPPRAIAAAVQRTKSPHSRAYTPRPDESGGGTPLEGPAPSSIARILSGTSMNGTPRSSGEFYSMSNNSTETLASEYVPHPSARLLPRIVHSRQSSQIRGQVPRSAPETIMMGYAQIMGNFTVDGSLINQAPFEEVKRKGVLGGQGGGGVVGVERTKRESGLFGALGWGSFGESLGGILGAGEPSSIREMRGIANSKAVPLLSTPQSILFVDLRLAPGESRSYKYTFTLPRGLPPSHKGRAIKVNYHVTIGTQRAGAAVGQHVVKKVEVPFRVIGSVTGHGEILGHDLMSPYVLLRDQAKTEALGANGLAIKDKSKLQSGPLLDAASQDFTTYVDDLLSTPANPSGLLSPTTTGPRRRSFVEEPASMKEAIDLAILRSNTAAFGGSHSTNRFEIARSGRRVAVIHLQRPAYRLGETITAIIDFSAAAIPTYSVLVTLETCEKVDPAIALRSNSSIYRATRKVHASFAENALYARTLVFTPTVPPTATPEFITSGVSLEWKVRVEFTTPRLTAAEEEAVEQVDELLEEVAVDERGTILAAAERLPCESFEVAVPVRVYGAVVGGASSGLGGDEDMVV